MNNKYDVLIIGCGPCGIGTALKLKEAGINFAIIEGSTPGGKVNIAPRVDNYPGFTKIPGPELAVALFKKVMDNNIEMIYDFVNKLTKEDGLFKLEGNEGTYYAKYVVLASGTKEKKIGLEKEDELLGHGISYCALCDGHFFKDKTIVVIGGGNSALKEAIHLAHIGKKLYVVHRRNEFRGNAKLVDELKEFEHVEILTPYIPVEILGEEKVTGVVLENRETGERKTIETDGLFPLVGQIPNTQFVEIENVKDEYGLVPVDKEMQSSCVNLYAGGDILPRDIRQIYLAQHDGMVIANSIIKKINQ